jgi:hypothetical protein
MIKITFSFSGFLFLALSGVATGQSSNIGSTQGPIETILLKGNTEIPRELQLLTSLQGPSSSIELVDGQRKQLKALMSNFIAEGNDIHNSLSGEARIKRISELKAKLRKDIRGIFLPFQAKTWASQMLVRDGLTDTLCSSELFDGMELSKIEEENVRKKSNETAIQLEEEINRLKLNAYKKVVDSLPLKQKKKLLQSLEEDAVESSLLDTPIEIFIRQLRSKPLGK